ncbi:hypothetical protein D1P53_005981 [Cryptococcus gattii VGV]|nr:hypothetical protein D1P53_005981 [Cryptococcus gattii VGV]
MSRPSIEMNLPPSLLNFYQKQQEYAGLQALREASADLVARAEKLAEMSNIMADGGEAIGGVLRNWPHVFSILSLFTAQMEQASGDRSRQEDEEDEEPLPCLVRLAYGGETPSVEGSAPTTTTASDKTKQ